MPRQANGTYLQPANTAAVSGTSIASAANNTLITDIATEITNSVDRGGRSAMTAALPMGAQKITGLADPTVATDAANKNYVDTTTAAFFSTGDVKPTFKTVADAGWIMMLDGTLGNAGSGALNAATVYQALYTLLWTNISSPSANAWCAVTGGLGASAAADWAGLKPLALPKILGRALIGAGAGAGLTSRVLGTSLGTETVTLAASNIPTITATNASQSITVSGNQGNIVQNNGSISSVNASGGAAGVFSASGLVSAFTPTATGSNSISTTYTNSSQTSFSIMQPGIWLNVMIKY